MEEELYTLVIGATTKPDRYAFLAVNKLLQHGKKVYALGLREGNIGEVEIKTGFPDFKNVHTVSLYINPTRQPEYYQYIIGLEPERVIFNPGTENGEFEKLIRQNGIETLTACTLVMLSTNQF